MVLRWATALAVLASALLHGFFYLDWAHSLSPLGPAFLAQAAVGIAVAVSVVVSRSRWALLVAAAYGLGSIAAFVLSSTTGFLGVTAQLVGWQEVVSKGVELLAVTFALLGHGRESRATRHRAPAV